MFDHEAHGHWAGVILLDQNGEVPLIKELRSRAEKAYYKIPGGGKKFDEGWSETALRELYEETGVRLSHAELGEPMVINHRETHDFVVFCVVSSRPLTYRSKGTSGETICTFSPREWLDVIEEGGDVLESHARILRGILSSLQNPVPVVESAV